MTEDTKHPYFAFKVLLMEVVSLKQHNMGAGDEGFSMDHQSGLKDTLSYLPDFTHMSKKIW